MYPLVMYMFLLVTYKSITYNADLSPRPWKRQLLNKVKPHPTREPHFPTLQCHDGAIMVADPTTPHPSQADGWFLLVLLAVSQWISILNRMVINWVREVWEAGWVGGGGGGGRYLWLRTYPIRRRAPSVRLVCAYSMGRTRAFYMPRNFKGNFCDIERLSTKRN